MRTMILRSVDHEYVRVVAAPDRLGDDDAAATLAEFVISFAKQLRPEEWSWEEDIEPALLEAGFEAVSWFHGPYWDAD